MTSQDVIPVRVFVRSRPFNGRENSEHARPCLTFYNESNQIAISGKMFAFDSVMDPCTSQKTAFELTTQSLIDKFMQGFNCTILAYGQTGSGKTYTMGTEETTESMKSDERGIIPRLVEQLFDAIKSSESPSAYHISVSMLEIYDEKVNDLLSSAKDLPVREEKGTVVVSGLTHNVVKDLPATMRQLETGCQLRSKGETAMNAKSSRSHAIFTINVNKTAMTETDTAFKSKLHLVDLAGSERLKKTQAEGERMKEGIRINEGLLALGNVISALSEPGNHKHIPYRDSRITRLLQDSLGGNSYTVMIACISPADTNADETLSTLRYADRAKKIKNKPIVNEDVGQAALLKQLQEKIRQLEQQLAERRDSVSSDYEPPEKRMVMEEFQLEMDALLQTQAKLFFTKNHLEDRVNKLTEEMKDAKESILTLLQTCNDENRESVLRKIESMVTAQAEAVDLSAVEIIDDAENVEETDAAASKAYVARQSQIASAMANIDDKIKTNSGIVETTNHDIERMNIHEKENAVLAEKVSSLEAEREKLNKELKKTTSCGKLAEERRQRVKELELQITSFKKQLADYKRLEKAKHESEQKVKQMNEEIVKLKQARIKLQKEAREENEKFRTQKLQAARQMTQMMAKERKKDLAHSKEMQDQAKRFNVLKVKLANSEMLLKKFSASQAEKNRLGSRLGSGQEKSWTFIKKYIVQEIRVQTTFLETNRDRNKLVADRARLYSFITANQKAIDKLHRALAHGAAEPEKLREEIEWREKENEAYQQQLDELNAQIEAILEKHGEYDEDAASEERFKTIENAGQIKPVIKYLFEMLCAATDEKSGLEEDLSNSRKERKEAEELDQILDAEKDATVEPPKRSRVPSKFYGNVVNSETNIQGTPQTVKPFKKHPLGKNNSRRPDIPDLSPIEDPDAAQQKRGRRSDNFKEPLPRSSAAKTLDVTSILERTDENTPNSMNATFVKTSPKRHHDEDDTSGDAPPFKIKHSLDASLGGIP